MAKLAPGSPEPPQRQRLRVIVVLLAAASLAALLAALTIHHRAESALRSIGCELTCSDCALTHPYGCTRHLAIKNGVRQIAIKGPEFASAVSTLNVETMALGGVRSVSVSVDILEALQACTVTELDLAGTTASNDHMPAITRIQSLRRLILGASYYPDAGDRNRIRFPPSQVDDIGLRGMRELRQLRFLNLRGLSVSFNGVHHIVGLPIEELNLAETAVSDECLEHVAGMNSLRLLVLSERIPSLSSSPCDPRQYTSSLVSVAGVRSLSSQAPFVTVEYPIHVFDTTPVLPQCSAKGIVLAYDQSEQIAVSRDGRIECCDIIITSQWEKVTGALARHHDGPRLVIREDSREWQLYFYSAHVLVLSHGDCYWASGADPNHISQICSVVFGTDADGE